MLRGSTLLLALVFSAPAIWQAWHGSMSVDEAIIRFLLALPVAGLLLALLRGAFRRDSHSERDPHRR